MQEGNLIFTDPPRHRQLRKLINSGFTRRQVALLEPKVREIVKGILDGVDPLREYEFAEEIAAPLPTRLIAEMLGAPPDDWEQFRTWSDAAVGVADPDIEMDHLVALGELYEYFTELIAARRSGEVAGRDDLLQHPRGGRGRRRAAQRRRPAQLLLPPARRGQRDDPQPHRARHPGADRAPGPIRQAREPIRRCCPRAVEEMLRFTSPVTHMARQATEDVEIRGQQIKAGDTVVMLYGSANRDEEVFGPTSEDFDITRNPNPHIAFGCR